MKSITTPDGYVIDKPLDIILITCNRVSRTKETIEQLHKRLKTPFRLIVIDDMSIDDTPMYLRQQKDIGNVDIFEQLDNSNICQAYNAGFKHVESDYFFTMQDDITVPELDTCVMLQLIDLMEKNPGHAGIGCRIQRIPNMNWLPSDITPARKSLSAYFRVQHKKTFENLPEPFGNRNWDDAHFVSFFRDKMELKCSWANNLWADHSRGYCLDRGYYVKPRKWGTGIHSRTRQAHIEKPYPIIDPKTNVPLSIVNADKKVKRNVVADRDFFGYKMRTRVRYYDEKILAEELDPDKNMYRIPDNLDVMIDIGAHIGGTTLRAAKAGATVFAFEPELYNYETLCYNVRRNRLHDRVHHVNQGVGKPGRTKLYVHDRSSGTTSSYLEQSGLVEDNYQITSFIDLHRVFKHYDIKHCGLLKMDCEGGEIDIIRELDDELVSRIDQISLEFHNKGTIQELVNKLSQWYKPENTRRYEWVFRKL